jgi:gluconokinase
MTPPKGFLIMGVSGSGKTTLARALAQRLGWDYFDGDDLHSSENVAKMMAGIPLSDSDRTPWLASLHDLLLSTLEASRHPVLACSALKEKYRLQLLDGTDGIAVVYLKGSYELIWSRMSARMGHYMRAEMLQSQFVALEEPQNAFVLDISMPVDIMVEKMIMHYFPEKGV